VLYTLPRYFVVLVRRSFVTELLAYIWGPRFHWTGGHMPAFVTDGARAMVMLRRPMFRRVFVPATKVPLPRQRLTPADRG
jgi:hypothetical protein